MTHSNSKETRHIIIGVDGNYLHKSLIFYKTLSEFHNNFILHIFCFDDVAFNILNMLKYKNIHTYHTSEFETDDILKVKATKDRMYEYYWTLNPHITRKVIKEQDCEFVTLADCDLMFFQSPEVIFDEFKNADVIIQPNNYSCQFDNDFARYGYYCTSFQCFRNNTNGKKILDYWYGKCMEWCSHIGEDGKFGDQKYLDDWRIRFRNVREVTNMGTNIAPWNVQKFDFCLIKNKVYINDKWPLIYYHYHSFKMNLLNYKYIITGDRNLSYPLSDQVIKLIYKPYIKRIKNIVKELKTFKQYRTYIKTNPEGNYHIQKISLK